MNPTASTDARIATIVTAANIVVDAVREAGPGGMGEGPLIVFLESAGVPWEAARRIVNLCVDSGRLKRSAGHCITAA